MPKSTNSSNDKRTGLPDWRTMQGMIRTSPSLTKVLEQEHREELAREDERLCVGLPTLPKPSTLNIMTVEAIKEAIAGLPEQERATLAAWLIEREYDAWDRQMAKDFSPSGRGHHLVEQVKPQIAAGEFTPMKPR